MLTSRYSFHPAAVLGMVVNQAIVTVKRIMEIEAASEGGEQNGVDLQLQEEAHDI